MLRKLLSRRGSPATTRTSQPTSQPDIKLRAAAVTEAWINSDNIVDQEVSEKQITAQISLAENEQKMLKKRGEVAKVVRRQKAQVFRVERDSHDSGYSTMTEAEIEDCYNNAAVWADDLQSDPMYLEDNVRKSLSLPDWAVSTALEAMHGNYKPAEFDWLEYDEPFFRDTSSRPELKDYEEGDFVGWCESLMDSVFALTEEENHDIPSCLSISLGNEEDGERRDFFVPLEDDEEDMEQLDGEDDGFAYRVGTFVAQHRVTIEQAPLPHQPEICCC